MLWAILSCLGLMSLVVRAQSDELNCSVEYTNTEAKKMAGMSTYAVDIFGTDTIFSYAMNKCTAVHVIPYTYYMYSCVQDGTKWTVTKTEYPTSQCEADDGTLIETWNEGDSEYGTPGYFSCDGEENYVTVKIAALPDCVNNGQTVYGGLSGCLMNSPLLTNFYCDSTQAIVQFFRNISDLADGATTDMPGGYCDSSLLCETWNFGTDSCTELGTVAGNTLYGKMEDCVATFAETPEDSSPVSFSILTISFALLASLFWL